MAQVQVLPDPHSLAQAAANHIAESATQAIQNAGRFSLALSGGSTPVDTYARLSRPPLRDSLDWERIHLFWGDERCTPPDHPESNYRMARRSLLDQVPIPAGNVHRIEGELAPETAAHRYETELRGFFRPPENMPPRFDLILLGMGADGHTASLFPGTGALRQRGRWAVANYVEQLDSWRVTLTAPTINAARRVLFLVSGHEKAEALKQVLEGQAQPEVYPAQLIRPEKGRLLWLADAEAASLLNNP